MVNYEPNELNVEYLSVLGLNPFCGNNSSPRAAMFSSHLTQRLIIKDPSPHRIQTGMEQEFAKYTLSVSMPEDGKIIKVIERYPRILGPDSINFNPETLVIYESEATKKIGSFIIPYYKSYHQYFGFQCKIKNTVSKLSPGSYIEKGTIFADTPAVDDEGGYNYGIELNVAFMSHPAVSEDGILISRDVLDKLKFKVFETREIEFGNGCFPLNLYGTIDNYKPFPDINEYIRDDGLLVMLRDYDTMLSPIETSIFDVMEPDHIFDNSVYVRGKGGKIVDIKVYHTDETSTSTPLGVETALTKYVNALKYYYTEIVNVEKELRGNYRKKHNNNSLRITPEFHRLVVEAMSVLDTGGVKSSEKLTRSYRTKKLDDYRVEFVIEYEITPDIGFKLTDTHGGRRK